MLICSPLPASAPLANPARNFSGLKLFMLPFSSLSVSAIPPVSKLAPML
ncbi:hypothetical protein [Helicobacter sp. T3_23-1059]